MVVVVVERERRGWKNRHMRDNIPCREASAVKLVPDHTSKLDAVLVGPCFYTVFVGEKRREEKREERREKREEGREREGAGEREREEKRRERERRKEERREEKRRRRKRTK